MAPFGRYWKDLGKETAIALHNSKKTPISVEKWTPSITVATDVTDCQLAFETFSGFPNKLDVVANDRYFHELRVIGILNEFQIKFLTSFQLFLHGKCPEFVTAFLDGLWPFSNSLETCSFCWS
jgi:hypothetical protein